jgi:hypothetical protein
MGPIDWGFDFLGYHHTRAGFYPSKATTRRFHTQLNRLYEQGAPPGAHWPVSNALVALGARWITENSSAC